MRKQDGVRVTITGEAADYLFTQGERRGDGPAAELQRCIETYKFLADAVLDGARIIVVDSVNNVETTVDAGFKTHFNLWEEQLQQD